VVPGAQLATNTATAAAAIIRIGRVHLDFPLSEDT
jgi:hypothetical protein